MDEAAGLPERLLEMVTGSWRSCAAYAAAELRIADLLAGGPRPSEDLAAATGADAPSLHRLLRALTTIDLCRERDDGAFEITPLGALLGTDAPGSLRAWTLWWGAYLWPVWGRLLYSVRTGQSARALLTGAEGFQHLEGDPQAAAVFHRAMVELSRLTTASVLRAYDFSSLGRIVDVGGGSGELLAAVLRGYPAARGVLFDRPHAIEQAEREFTAAGLADRCEFVAGDFFERVPADADAYVLQTVLHDWDDERSARILSTCRRAMAPASRLLVIERVLPERLEATEAHQSAARSDLHMLVALAGRERTEAELRALLAAAGLRVSQVLPVLQTYCVIEARSAS
jgi:SAM-dependent methyltransferase